MTSPFSDQGPSPFNPYAAAANVTGLPQSGDGMLPDGQMRGLVTQVPVIGILMIVQGVLIGLMGLVAAGYALMLPTIFQEMQKQAAKENNPGPQFPIEMGPWFTIAGVVVGVLILALGILTGIAGYRVMQYRSRVFALTMLSVGLTTVMTCYCAPTAIGMFIYGLIVLLNQPVKVAFELRSTGKTVQEIQRAFALLP